MAEDKNYSLISKPPSALEKALSGTQHILSGMVAETLALAQKAQVISGEAKFRIGEYEWREPDYRQIRIWAKALTMEPNEVVERLLNGGRIRDDWEETRFCEGRLLKINWDFELLPLAAFEWSEGLKTSHLSLCPDLARRHNMRTFNPALPDLTHLSCLWLHLGRLNVSKTPKLVDLCCFANGLIELDLSSVHHLRTLDCCLNKLTQLDLSAVGSLEELYCSGNGIGNLELSVVPNLTKLICQENEITQLDLSKVPRLENLGCISNPLQVLDIRPLQHLKVLTFDTDKAQLIQRPDQHF